MYRKCISLWICSYIGNKARTPTFNIRGQYKILNVSWPREGVDVPSIGIAAARAVTWSGASALNCPGWLYLQDSGRRTSRIQRCSSELRYQQQWQDLIFSIWDLYLHLYPQPVSCTLYLVSVIVCASVLFPNLYPYLYMYQLPHRCLNPYLYLYLQRHPQTTRYP